MAQLRAAGQPLRSPNHRNPQRRSAIAQPAVDNPLNPPLVARSYPVQPGFSGGIPCPDGGIGRRTSFRCWRSQGRGGSSPLLGTKSLKSLSKSSERRSTQRVCNDLLLRFGSSVEARKSQNSAGNRARGCYDFTPENLPKGMCVRGGQHRRNVPKDAQGLIGRTEIWRRGFQS